MQLYPKGDEERCSKSVSLYLQSLSDIDAYVGTSFAVVNSEDEAVNNDGHSYYLFQNDNIGSPQFIEHDYLFNNKEDLIPQDKFTVRCELFLDKSEEYYEKIEKGKVEDFEDFGMLFNNEKLSDVTILVSDDERKFYAHKHVLAKKQEVFAAMFKYDTIESKNNSVNIQDVQYEAMEEMLRYIYTGEIFNIADSTRLDLIKAADKYQILDLKEMCEKDIVKTLSDENALKILAVADQSNATTLKERTIEFIVANAKTIVEKTEFDFIMNLHPLVVREIFRKTALKDVSFCNM